MKAETLMQEIEAAFPYVDKPKGLALSFHKDDCWHCRELREDLEPYSGKEVPAEVIRYMHQDMSCLSAQGWLWALPSYLRVCIAQEGDYDAMETEFLIYNFAPKEEHQEETRQRFSAFNRAQVQCLVHFLEWCGEKEHWSQYCPEDISTGIAFLSTLSPET